MNRMTSVMAATLLLAGLAAFAQPQPPQPPSPPRAPRSSRVVVRNSPSSFLGVEGVLRISLHCFNTHEEVDTLVACLKTSGR